MNNRFENGLTLLSSLAGKDLRTEMENDGPLGQMTCSFVYNDIYGRDGLSVKDRELITVAIIAALRVSGKPIKNHMRMAIRSGATVEELEEVLLQVAAYAGFPAAVSAESVLREIKESK